MEEITKKSSGFRRPSFDALKQRASSKIDDLKEKMRRSSVSEKLESVARMGHIDRSFFGENGSGDGDEEEMSATRRTQEGLRDSDPDRAETDFFNGDKYVGDTADGKRHEEREPLGEPELPEELEFGRVHTARLSPDEGWLVYHCTSNLNRGALIVRQLKLPAEPSKATPATFQYFRL